VKCSIQLQCVVVVMQLFKVQNWTNQVVVCWTYFIAEVLTAGSCSGDWPGITALKWPVLCRNGCRSQGEKPYLQYLVSSNFCNWLSISLGNMWSLERFPKLASWNWEEDDKTSRQGNGWNWRGGAICAEADWKSSVLRCRLCVENIFELKSIALLLSYFSTSKKFITHQNFEHFSAAFSRSQSWWNSQISCGWSVDLRNLFLVVLKFQI